MFAICISLNAAVYAATAAVPAVVTRSQFSIIPSILKIRFSAVDGIAMLRIPVMIFLSVL